MYLFVGVQLEDIKVKAADFLSRRRVEAKRNGSAGFGFPGGISSPPASKTFNCRQGRINFRNRRFNSDSMNDVYQVYLLLIRKVNLKVRPGRSHPNRRSRKMKSISNPFLAAIMLLGNSWSI